MVLLMLSTVTKKDIISLGFSPYQSQRVIREAKALLVERGCHFYSGKKISCVPVSVVEEILGIEVNKSGKDIKCL
ncbi:DUF3173 domain-containing protein [Enterococcus faecalis]|uniref:DUF3173 domain-containing protein n=1 Tax=Enterococcus faecalis TaxID=1351 RepID=UPI0010410782|nr:DUF3173 domain-containing protein [Enterococcus faecalis]